MRYLFMSMAVQFSLFSCDQGKFTDAQPVLSIQRKALPTNHISSQKQVPVLFVQWQYPSTITSMQILDMRQKMEQKINNALKAINVGHWLASDLGQGGVNMLFETKNKIVALNLIQDIITKEGIYKETVIAERIYTATDEWTYSVIYPKDYKGLFTDL